MKDSGSGIYAARSGALDTFVSESSATKILIADVPTNLSSVNIGNNVEEIEYGESCNTIGKFPDDFKVLNKTYDQQVHQQDMKFFTLKFLDFSERLSHKGTICNGDFCCKYDVDVVDNGPKDGMVTFTNILPN